MSADLTLRGRGSRIFALIGRLRPPVTSGQFWLVQAGVLLVAFLDEVVLDYFGVQLPLGIPNAKITALLLIPVIYAALNFGVRGGVGTALWATALMFPDWLFIARESTANTWVEIGNLVILNAVAIIVGQRVEREGQARRRAEEALRASEAAEARYRALFDEQHAPVLVTDAAGVVTEANAAATSLLGAGVPGRLLSDLVDTPVAAILNGAVSRLPVGDRTFAPKARTFDVGSGGRLVQIVLVDVTEEERRLREQRAYAAHLVTVQEDERRTKGWRAGHGGGRCPAHGDPRSAAAGARRLRGGRRPAPAGRRGQRQARDLDQAAGKRGTGAAVCPERAHRVPRGPGGAEQCHTPREGNEHPGRSAFR